ncbi:Rv2578c family radical SAM protein [Spirillospora sp. NPDC029432]|uniref:Rv2578c family radical SAM protein n=1 Tax=Spirillospora sp. NPDC029432 TaxID=3154599 RepID=UPI003451EEA5
MRWDHLRLAGDEGNAAGAGGGAGPGLPLIERGAVARTFDTPGFRGMTFYEVHARSVINKVPAASRVPFRWTVNPYRGCSHACSYCLDGATPVLLAGGRTRPIRDLRPGDRVYGTRRTGLGRRWVVTEVFDHWRTVRRAYRVTLAGGTELVCSGDHRFLGVDGWRYTAGHDAHGRARPALEAGDRLVAVGAPPVPGRRGPREWAMSPAVAPSGLPAGDSAGEGVAAGIREAAPGAAPAAGALVEAWASVAVVSVEALGCEREMFDITTGTGDFVAGGVVSHNCFARKTHEYLDLDSGADFDSRIVVKVNAAERLRRELAAPRWRGEHIAMGTNVDCYQRAEGRYRLMPGIIGALRDAGNPFSILTKGALILRDVPLLAEAAERAEVGTAVSVGSLDRDLARLVEPGTPAPERRLEVCAALTGAGLECGVLMGPVLPYLSDSPARLEAVVARAAEAGATSVSPIVLHLRPGAREWFLSWLREHHRDLVVPYARLYRGGAYAPRGYQERIAGQVAELARRYGIGRRARPRRGAPPPSPPAGRAAEQLTLPM